MHGCYMYMFRVCKKAIIFEIEKYGDKVENFIEFTTFLIIIYNQT